ncbi:hypothetical protein PP304_gp066 [Gordonia phage Phendrix]|uniref:Uncharacterized protein n=1 Tax=Gordonia phage Phendrix TaxID=2593335 RepID=A0A514U0Y2_9CAUD|nr:hypothetical protein PP304_gp066 [Gordonia phage Phendrix]QDK02614.1 hypothetical protein SEA_PHENDRIX_66 [Gordonia phage Phendrix]
MGHTAQGWREALTAAFKIRRGDWNEALHPRGADGRWIDKLGSVKWKGLSGLWETGTVESWNDKGAVTVKKPDGTKIIQPAKKLYSARQQVVKMPTKLTTSSNPRGLSGSNPGGVMQEPSGDKWYVKTPQSAAHTANEIAGHKMYALAGVPVPTTAMSSDGKKFASKLEDAEDWNRLTGTDLDEAKAEIRKNFVVDAWLANWDAPANDNIRVNSDGVPLRVDTGGSLDFRARGGRRTLTMDVPELKTMRDPRVSPSGSRLYDGLTRAEEEDAVRRILGVTPDAIREAIKDAGAPSRLADNLITRRAWLANNYGYELPEETKAGKDAIAAAKKANPDGAAPNLTPIVRRSTAASPLAPNSPVWLKNKKKYGEKDDTWIINSVAADKKTAQLRQRVGGKTVDVDVADFELLRDNFASVNAKYTGGESVEVGDKVLTAKGDTGEITEIFPMYAKVKIDGTNRSQVLAVKKMTRTKGALPDAATSVAPAVTPPAQKNDALYNNGYQDAWGKLQTTHRGMAERYVRNGVASKKTFDLNDVRPTQPEDTSTTSGSGSGAKDLDPIVAQINGELYLMDGHHRALASDGKLDAHFVDFDSIKVDPSGLEFDFSAHDFTKTPHPKVYSLTHNKELAVFKYDSAQNEVLVVTPDGMVGPITRDKVRDPKTVDHDGWVAAQAAAAAGSTGRKRKGSNAPQLTPQEKRQQKIDNMTSADVAKMKPQAVNVKYPAAGGSAQVMLDPGMRAIKFDNAIFVWDTRDDSVKFVGKSTKSDTSATYSLQLHTSVPANRDMSGTFLQALAGGRIYDVKELTAPEGVKAAQILAKDNGRTISNVDDLAGKAKYRLLTVTAKLPDEVLPKVSSNPDHKLVTHALGMSASWDEAEKPLFLQSGSGDDADFYYYGTGANPLDTPVKLTDTQKNYYFEASSAYGGSQTWYEIRGSMSTTTPDVDDSKLLTYNGKPLRVSDANSYQSGSRYVRSIAPVYRMMNDPVDKSIANSNVAGTTQVPAPGTRSSSAAAPSNKNNEELEAGKIHKGFAFPRPKFKLSPTEALSYKITASREAMNNGEYDDQFLEFSLGDRLEVASSGPKGIAKDGTPQYDPMMYEFVQSHGGDAVPPRLSKSDFDQYVIDNSRPELYRGVKSTTAAGTSASGVELRNELQRGAHFAGRGVYGNGTYAATSRTEASHYGSAITRMTYRPDAKVGLMSEVVGDQMEEYGTQSDMIEKGLADRGLLPKKSDATELPQSDIDNAANWGSSKGAVDRFYDVQNMYIGYNLPSQYHDDYRAAVLKERKALAARAKELHDFYKSKGYASVSVRFDEGTTESTAEVMITDANGDTHTIGYKSSMGPYEFSMAYASAKKKLPKPYRTLQIKEQRRSWGRDTSDPTSTETSSSSYGKTMTPQRMVRLAALADKTYDGLEPVDEYKKSPDARSQNYKNLESLFKIAARMQYIQDPARFGFIAGYDGYTLDSRSSYHVFTHRAPLIFQNGAG